jgi:transcriptional regulator with XRE-family HTH domain
VPSVVSLVARRIQEIRIAKGMSRQGLGDLVGKTYLQIYRIEKGETEVTTNEAVAIADALEVSVSSLFRESKAAS